MKKAILAVLMSAFLIVGVIGCAEEAKADGWDDNPFVGAQGERGPRGYTGPRGPRGYTGSDGATGSVGATGRGFDSSALDFGLASSAALANIPDDLGVNKTAVGVGVGFYDKTDAVALGLVHRYSDSWLVKASVAQSLTKQLDDNGKHALWGVGAAYSF